MDKNQLFLEMMDLSVVEKTKLLKDAYKLFEKMNNAESQLFFELVEDAVKWK